MHIINKSFLKLALLPATLYRRMGINTAHLSAILTTKLTMDDRRPNTLHQTSRKKKDAPVKAATLGTILVSAVMGLIYLISFAIGQNMTTHLLFYFSFFFFMLAASLISDFTAVLIDVRDNYIILPKPVTDRTIVTARILHIFIHICKLVVPMCLPGLVYIILNYGALGGICFLLMVLLLTLFVIFFINALYILILRVTTPSRFQAVISYIQIIFAIILYASYQLLPRLAGQLGADSFDATAHRPLFLMPMYWFASGWNTLYTLNGNLPEILLLLLCITVPLVSLYAVVKYLAPSFNNKLALLNSVSTETQKPAAQTGPVKTTSAYVRAWSRIVTRPGAERMGFLFTWKMTGRSRDFKVKVYPSIGYLLVIMIMLFLRSGNTIHLTNLDNEGGRIIVISALYFTSILLITAVNHISLSEKFKGAWIYFIAPVQKPGEIICGALKAALLKFYIPVVVLVLVGGLSFIGIAVLPNIILGLFNQVLITTLIVYGNNKVLPFSLQQQNNARGGGFIKNMLLLMVSALVGLCHFLVYHITGVIVIFTVLSLLLTWLMLGSIRNIGWQKIQRAYAAA